MEIKTGGGPGKRSGEALGEVYLIHIARGDVGANAFYGFGVDSGREIADEITRSVRGGRRRWRIDQAAQAGEAGCVLRD